MMQNSGLMRHPSIFSSYFMQFSKYHLLWHKISNAAKRAAAGCDNK
jgi:hypothetical protein